MACQIDITNAIEQSREANRSSANKEASCIFSEQNFYYRLHNSQSRVPNLSLINTVKTFLPIS